MFTKKKKKEHDKNLIMSSSGYDEKKINWKDYGRNWLKRRNRKVTESDIDGIRIIYAR